MTQILFDMKRIIKYGIYTLLAVLATMSFQSCNDDKDIVMINDELPLKIDHLYMVGDATPAGWSIDNPTELTKDANDKFVFTYHGKLTTGFLKFPLSKGDWGATFIYAPAAGTEINAQGVAKHSAISKGCFMVSSQEKSVIRQDGTGSAMPLSSRSPKHARVAVAPPWTQRSIRCPAHRWRRPV